jgi:RNA polymerase sigma-70 factor (ECF subfamily)
MTPQWERDLDALVATRGRALLGYAYLLTRHEPDAADLVQDALLATFQRLGRRSGDVVALEGYVRTAILRLFLNQTRRRRLWVSVRPRLAHRAPEPPMEDALLTEHSLGAALAGLSPMQRAAFALQYFADLTVEDIATELGCSAGGAKRHLADARQRLAAALRPELKGEPRA